MSTRRLRTRTNRGAVPSRTASPLLGLREARLLVLTAGGRGKSSLADSLRGEGIGFVLSTPERAAGLDGRFDCVIAEWTADLHPIEKLAHRFPELGVLLVSGGCSSEELRRALHTIVVDRPRAGRTVSARARGRGTELGSALAPGATRDPELGRPEEVAGASR